MTLKRDGPTAASETLATLQYIVQSHAHNVQLVVGPLPPGTTSSQVTVEVSAAAVLEISLAGSSTESITYQLPEGLSDEELKVKFSKKRSTLTVSWAVREYEEGERSRVTTSSLSKSIPSSGPLPPHGNGEAPLLASPESTLLIIPAACAEVSDGGSDVPSSSPALSAEADGSSSTFCSTVHLSSPVSDSTTDPKTAASHSAIQGVVESLHDAGLSAEASDAVGRAEEDKSGEDVKSLPCEEERQESVVLQPRKLAKSRKKKGKKGKAADQKELTVAAMDTVHGLEDLEATADSLAEQLLSRGFAYVDEFLSPEVVNRILAETCPLHDFFEPGEIWVGKEAQAGAQVARDDVRGDSILWMNFPTMVSNNCHTLHRAMRRMDTLIMNLLPRRVPRLAHISEHSDAMLSIYPPPSGRFQKHIDNTARDGRCLTVLLYLNVGWKPEMGGALKLWPLKTGQVEGSLITTAAQTLSRGAGVEPVELLPIAGRLAMFYSDRVLHEVLPTLQMRYAVTQWYYDRNERAEAMAAAKVAASATPAGKGRVVKGRGGGAGGVDAQAEAHSFIRALMVDTSQPTPELIDSLINQVEALSSDALRMASQIMGASTPEDLIKAVRGFTPQGLSELRDELARMGQ